MDMAAGLRGHGASGGPGRGAFARGAAAGSAEVLDLRNGGERQLRGRGGRGGRGALPGRQCRAALGRSSGRRDGGHVGIGCRRPADWVRLCPEAGAGRSADSRLHAVGQGRFARHGGGGGAGCRVRRRLRDGRLGGAAEGTAGIDSGIPSARGAEAACRGRDDGCERSAFRQARSSRRTSVAGAAGRSLRAAVLRRSPNA